MTAVVYDAGALIAAERDDRQMWADHKVRLQRHVVPVVPTVVVAQVSRSPRQVNLRRLLRGCDVAVLAEQTAHHAGALLAASATTDVVDAVVAIEANRRDATIVTSDRADIVRLIDALRTSLRIVEI